MTSAGERRATILDVAKLAGVAISSASAALNGQPGVSDATRERVRLAAQKLHYVPSFRGRSLSGKKAFAIGLILERDFTVLEADPFFSAFIGGIEESLAPHNYALLLQIVDGAEASLSRHTELVDSRRVDGMILSELRVNDARVSALRTRDTPAVGINPGGHFPFAAVTQDNSAAIHDLVRHLRAQGHTRIGFLSGPPEYVHSAQRLEAWQHALQAEGLSYSRIVDGDFTHDGGVAAADRMLSGGERPTAVFCANDLMAIGFMNRAIEIGIRVPDDVAVAGFDGINLGSYVRPTLTTIATDPHALGREASELLMTLVSGNEAKSVAIRPASLLIRTSTASSPEQTSSPR